MIDTNPSVNELPAGPPISPADLAILSMPTPPCDERMPVDFKVLEEFQEMMGDEGKEMAKNLVRLYLADSPVLIEQMRLSIATANLDNLHRAAHTLKGNSSQLGMIPLSERSAELEKLAKSGSTDGAEGMLERIRNEFTRVDFSLKAAFPDTPTPLAESNQNMGS